MKKVSSLVLVAWFGVAIAADDGLSAKYSSCMDKSGGVTVDMLGCIGEETKSQDARLNKAYKAVSTAIEPSRAKALQDAQRAWIKYRDTNCNFYADPEGGTMATVTSNDCILTTTADRAKELEGISGSLK